jgi:hypothetical protein
VKAYHYHFHYTGCSTTIHNYDLSNKIPISMRIARACLRGQPCGRKLAARLCKSYQPSRR